MSQNYLSDNSWDWNCSSKNDLDYRVLWGNNGNITILKKKNHGSPNSLFSVWNPEN